MGTLLLLLSTAFARCKEPATADEIRRATHVALQAYGEDRMSTFHRATAEASERLPCLGELVLPEALAGWYVVQGVQAFLDRRPEDMLDNFQIALKLDPDFSCDDRLGPEGHPLRLACRDAVSRPAFGTLPLTGCDPGALFVDGLASIDLPADRPFVVQLVGGRSGGLKGTWVVSGPDDLPDRLTCEVARTATRRTGVGAVGAAAVAGGTWLLAGVAVAQVGQVRHEVQGATSPGSAEDQIRLERAIARANALGFSAQAATGLAVGLGTVTLALAVRF